MFVHKCPDSVLQWNVLKKLRNFDFVFFRIIFGITFAILSIFVILFISRRLCEKGKMILYWANLKDNSSAGIFLILWRSILKNIILNILLRSHLFSTFRDIWGKPNFTLAQCFNQADLARNELWRQGVNAAIAIWTVTVVSVFCFLYQPWMTKYAVVWV